MREKILIAGMVLVMLTGTWGCRRSCARWKTATRSELGGQPPATEVSQPEALQSRPWNSQTVYYQNGAVSHPTLYLESCLDRYGSMNDRLGTWLGDDAASLALSPAVFLADIVRLPVSLVWDRPWQTRQSRDQIAPQEPAFYLPDHSFIPCPRK